MAAIDAARAAIEANAAALQAQAAAQANAEVAVQAARAGGSFIGVPQTARDLRSLRARRSELSTQLNSAEERRDRLSQELQRDRIPAGPAREGVEQRIRLLDERILQLEQDIAETGRLMAAAPASATLEPPRREGPGREPAVDYTAIAVVFNLAVLMPMAVAMARRIWKRTGTAPAAHPASQEDSQRLRRLEEAVDTIAIEVERISEGQRFVTQLMADSRQPQRVLGGAVTAEARR